MLELVRKWLVTQVRDITVDYSIQGKVLGEFSLKVRVPFYAQILFILIREHQSGSLPLAKTGQADGSEIPDNDVIGPQSAIHTTHAAALRGRSTGTLTGKCAVRCDTCDVCARDMPYVSESRVQVSACHFMQHLVVPVYVYIFIA